MLLTYLIELMVNLLLKLLRTAIFIQFLDLQDHVGYGHCRRPLITSSFLSFKHTFDLCLVILSLLFLFPLPLKILPTFIIFTIIPGLIFQSEDMGK